MKHYRVFIHGKNFLLRSAGQPTKVAFYTTRVVQAADEKAAENAAVETLRQRQSLRDVVLNDRTDPPLMYVEQITEVAVSAEEAQRPQPGLVWYAESEITKPTMSTKLGGVPHFIQSPDEAPKDGWCFVGQSDSTYSFLLAPTISVPGVVDDPAHWEGRSHYGRGPNFGDGGIAYLFLRDASPIPEGWFFWQCG